MGKKTFKEKLLFSGRKLAIAIKRNYYVIPMIFVFVVCMQFMCSLHIISPNFNRISYGEFNCMYVFIIALLTILASVAYLNFALKKFGQKRPIHMLIIYYVMVIITIVLLFYIFKSNTVNLAEELAKYNQAVADKNEASKAEALKYYTLGVKARYQLLTTIILSFVSVVLVTTAPFVQAALNKLKFKRIETENGK